MNPGKKTHFLFFVSILLVSAFIAPVAANVTIHFIDRSYLGDNPLIISNLSGQELFNGTTKSTSVEVFDNQAIWISFQPGGAMDIVKDPDFGTQEGLAFAQRFYLGLGILCFFGIVLLWRTRK